MAGNRAVIDGLRRPNPASQCLGPALRELPAEWQRVHGFRPLLAVSFHDPAVHQGALHKVTNSTALGLAKGFRRHPISAMPTRSQPARGKLDGRAADWKSEAECEHGRVEWRELRVVSFDLDIALFPPARQIISLTRRYREKNSTADSKSEVLHYAYHRSGAIRLITQTAPCGS